MKTYIWNTEYEVMVAQADNVDAARNLIHRQFVNQSCEGLLDEKDKEGLSKGSIPPYVYHRACSKFRSLDPLLQVFSKEPDQILDQYQAVIYGHANE